MAADVTRACSSEPPKAAPPPGQRTGGFCQLVRAVGRRLRYVESKSPLLAAMYC